jgi:response regulator NasT
MPLKAGDLISTVGMMAEGIERRRRRARLKPKVRSAEEENAIKEAKELLMGRNHLSEEEAHRYLQKCSMDSGTNMVETAFMVLSMMKD